MEAAAVSAISQLPAILGPAQNQVVEPTSATIQQFEGLMQPQNHPDFRTIPEGTGDDLAVPGTMGDSILRTLESMGNSLQTNADRLRFHLDRYGAVMDPSDMMQLQLDVFSLSLQQDLTAKIADRASQGIQTLFRNQ